MIRKASSPLATTLFAIWFLMIQVIVHTSGQSTGVVTNHLQSTQTELQNVDPRTPFLFLKKALPPRLAGTASRIKSHEAESSNDRSVHGQRFHLRGTRHLQEGGDIVSVIDTLLDTPMDEWDGEQFLVAFALVVFALVALCCCWCMCVLPMCCRGGGYYQPAYYGSYPGGYYGNGYYSGYGSNRGSCCTEILMLLCCWELCCRGGEDICCPNPEAMGDYSGGYMA